MLLLYCTFSCKTIPRPLVSISLCCNYYGLNTGCASAALALINNNNKGLKLVYSGKCT